MLNTIENIRRVVQTEFVQYEKHFAQALKSDVAVLNDIYDQILSHRGKQLRPLITLLSGKLCGKINTKTIDAAVVLEMMHTASLLHDDVVDDTHQRRGQKSVNEQWTNKLAILSGDYMLASAIKVLTLMRNTRIQQLVCDLTQRLSKGEVLELNYGGTMWITEQQYFDIILYKTACLFATCAEAGAISVGATSFQSTNLKHFGEELGLCFQMQDDILDYSDSDLLGKPTMNDIRDKKVTLPLIIALQRAPQDESEMLKNRIENEPFTWDLENDVKSFVMRYDGVRYVQQRIEEHTRKAKAALESFHPITSEYEALLQILEFSSQRNF